MRNRILTAIKNHQIRPSDDTIEVEKRTLLEFVTGGTNPTNSATKTMQKQKIDLYKKQLQEELAQIQSTVKSQLEQAEGNHESKDFVGGDRASELESMEVDSQIVDDGELYARKIMHALERIDDGTYGNCEGCGKEIPQERLDVKPSVSLCVPCQEKHEAA